jgi:hypothetical protein
MLLFSNVWERVKSWAFCIAGSLQHASPTKQPACCFNQRRLCWLHKIENGIPGCYRRSIKFVIFFRNGIHLGLKYSRSVAVPICETIQQVTVLLGVNCTGSIKLPTYLVFKGSGLPTGQILKELKKGEQRILPGMCTYSIKRIVGLMRT